MVPGFIYFTSLKHYTDDRVFNFLFFSIGLILLVSNGLTNNKKKPHFHSKSEGPSVGAESGPHKIITLYTEDHIMLD